MTRLNPIHRLSADEIDIKAGLGDIAAATAALKAAIGRLEPRRVIILIHGFEYDPRLQGGARDPYRAVFWEAPARTGRYDPAPREHQTHRSPWLTRLDHGPEELVICYAYASFPGGRHEFDGVGTLIAKALRFYHNRLTTLEWRGQPVNLFAYAYAQATLWGEGLAAVIAALALALPDGPKVDILCHSLGARVATAAIKRLGFAHEHQHGVERVGRVLMLAGAVAAPQIRHMRRGIEEASPKSDGIEFYNFATSADAVLRLIGAPLVQYAAHALADREVEDWAPSILRGLINPVAMIGVDGGGRAAAGLRWRDFELDCPKTMEWGRGLGVDLVGDLPDCRFDHWLHYSHADNWRLYNAILTGRPNWRPEQLTTGFAAADAREIPPLPGQGGGSRRSLLGLFR